MPTGCRKTGRGSNKIPGTIQPLPACSSRAGAPRRPARNAPGLPVIPDPHPSEPPPFTNWLFTDWLDRTLQTRQVSRAFVTTMANIRKDPEAARAELRSWQLRVFGLLWGAYASYYLCRVNFAVAQPAILEEFPDWTGAQIGSIPSTYAVAYAAGQMVNGTLGQRFGTRRMMTMGLVLASVTNLLFAFANSFSAMQVLWAINGWGQSAGWALMVQTISDWNRSEGAAL